VTSVLQTDHLQVAMAVMNTTADSPSNAVPCLLVPKLPRAIHATTPSVNILTMRWMDNPHFDVSSYSAVNSHVLTVSLFSPGAVDEVSVGMSNGIRSPVLFCLGVAWENFDTDLACAYWDDNSASWVTDGVLLVAVTASQTGINVVCAAMHLTDFVADLREVTIRPQIPNDVSDIGKLSGLGGVSLFVPIVVGALLCTALIAVLVSNARQAKLAKAHQSLERAHILLYGDVVPSLEREAILAKEAVGVDDTSVRKDKEELAKQLYQRLKVSVAPKCVFACGFF
jgi:hypothetical protein